MGWTSYQEDNEEHSFASLDDIRRFLTQEAARNAEFERFVRESRFIEKIVSVEEQMKVRLEALPEARQLQEVVRQLQNEKQQLEKENRELRDQNRKLMFDAKDLRIRVDGGNTKLRDLRVEIDRLLKCVENLRSITRQDKSEMEIVTLIESKLRNVQRGL